MRTITAPVRTLLRGSFKTYLRVDVADPSGVMQTIPDEWVIGGSFGDDIDSAVQSGQVRFRRGIGLAQSLAPLMASSAPQSGSVWINPGREIHFYTATVAHGASPAPSDWTRVFEGKIDRVGWPEEPIVCDIRDKGAYLLDYFIDTPRIYGSEAGTPMEEVMRSMLDDNGFQTWELHVPVAPLAMVSRFQQEPMSLLEALRNLAIRIGWDVKMRWRASDGVFVLTLYEPDRASTTPDDTFGPSEYLDVSRLEMSDENVRNKFKLTYINRLTGALATLQDKDDASIAAFGVRSMEWVLPADTIINTPTEAGRLMAAMKHDLVTPDAEQEIQTLYAWFVETHDLYRFTANNVHYDADQDWGVYGWRHELENGDGKTYIMVRGKPAGSYHRWIEQVIRQKPMPPSPLIGPPVAEGTKPDIIVTSPVTFNYDGEVHLPIRFDAHTDYVEIAASEWPIANQPDPLDSLIWTSAVRIRRPEGAVGQDPNFYTEFDIATQLDWFRRMRARGVSPDGTPGLPVIYEIQAKDIGLSPNSELGFSSLVAQVQNGNDVLVTGTLANAADAAVCDARIFRNGVMVQRIPAPLPSPVTWLDRGLTLGRNYTYEIELIRGGNTSARLSSAMIVGGTTQVPQPTWKAGLPSASPPLPGGVAHVWVVTAGFSNLLPGSTTFVEYSPDGGANWYPWPTQITGGADSTSKGWYVPVATTWLLRAYSTLSNWNNSIMSAVMPLNFGG